LLLVALMAAGTTRLLAHPVPFSYLDLRVDGRTLDVALVTHVFDVAHDLGVAAPESLLTGDALKSRGAEITALITSRLRLSADGQPVTIAWAPTPRSLVDRQSIEFEGRVVLPATATRIAIDASLFPYDPAHQTFVNVYQGTAVSQAALDARHTHYEYFAGSRQSAVAVVREFIPAGIHHILIGPDHLLFLVGLLLLGGTIRQLLIVVTSFTIAHSITLSLAALNIVSPPARLIEPAIALSIIYVGADNLLARNGRDVRAWIAFAFGFIHGFGFANVLREMELPRAALGWSLFAFNVGVEIGQLLVVVGVASLLAWLRSRSELAGRQVAFAGSVVVIAAGAFWFIQRVFFPGSL
jgi:hydrogenase/urease accessory protein HupE